MLRYIRLYRNLIGMDVPTHQLSVLRKIYAVGFEKSPHVRVLRRTPVHYSDKKRRKYTLPSVFVVVVVVVVVIHKHLIAIIILRQP